MVKASLVYDISEGLEVPGSFEYTQGENGIIDGMLYVCPCGCRAIRFLSFRPSSTPSWDWNGNLESPTLSPIVNHVNHWRGWLQDGEWKQS